MTQRVVVADSGPIIHLSMIECAHLLPALFGEVIVPRTVWIEVVEQGAGLPGSAVLAAAAWAKVVEAPTGDPVVTALLADLDPGEAAALAVGAALKADRLLIDDRAARRVAIRLGLPIIGTLGILVAGRRTGEVGPLAPLLAALRDQGFWMTRDLEAAILADVGELPITR